MLLQHSRPATQPRRSLPANPRTPVADAVAHAMHAAASQLLKASPAVANADVRTAMAHRASPSVQHAHLAVGTQTAQHVAPAVPTLNAHLTLHAERAPVHAMPVVQQAAARAVHVVLQALLPADGKN